MTGPSCLTSPENQWVITSLGQELSGLVRTDPGQTGGGNVELLDGVSKDQ